MATRSLPEYPSFNPTDTPKDASAWGDWLEGLNAMMDAMQIPEDQQAVADEANPANNRNAVTDRYKLFWHFMGNDTRKLLKKCDDNGIETLDYAKAHAALTKKFNPTLNRLYQMNVVHSMKQGEAESMDNFYVRVKDEVDKMMLTDLQVNQIIELIILAQLVNSTHNAKLTRKAINDSQSLTQFREFARTTELTEQQLTGMGQPENVSYAKKMSQSHKKEKRRTKSKRKTESKAEGKSDRLDRKCKYCGDSCVKGQCPAYGKVCSKCGKRNHLPAVCRNSQRQRYKTDKLHQLEEAEDEDLDSDESIYHIQQGSKQSKRQYFAKLDVQSDKGSKQIKFQLDTGASCSTLTEADYSKITSTQPRTSNARLRLYDGTVIQPMGCASFKCTADDVTKKIHFEIVKEAPMSLLSANACAALQLISFNEQMVCQVSSSIAKPLTKEEILHDYADIFKGLGKMPGTYHIEMDKDVRPVQNNPRRVPVPVRQELEQKLDELTNLKIIEKVTVPTPWISSMVVVKKPGKLRICLDPNKLNTAIQRNHYPTPTLDDVAPRLAKARVFSVMDAKDGFLQVELDEESSYLTTFWTPFGRFRWLRMPFGIKSAPEEFQRRLDCCLEGLNNVAVIADDILIYGTGDTHEEAVSSHDDAMRALLKRCRERNIKLNKKKLRFKMDEVSYMGHKLTKSGLSPCPDKVRPIVDMEKPRDIAGVQRLISVVTYLSKFLPRLSTVCESLRRFTDKDDVFDWLPQHEEAFKTVKQLISNAPVLRY